MRVKVLLRLVIKFLIWLVKLVHPVYWGVPTNLIYAQAKHETGNFSSAIFRENNNLFGMKVSKSTPHGFIEIGENKGHAVYKNWFDSIRDYYVRQRFFDVSSTQYVDDTVKSGYATDSGYKAKWLAVYEGLKPSTVKRVIQLTVVIIFLWGIVELVKRLRRS